MASSHDSVPIDTAPRPPTLPGDGLRQSASDGDGATSTSTSSSETESLSDINSKHSRLQRPKLQTRKSSGTIITHRDDPNIHRTNEDYGPEDARTMSPRKTSAELDRLGESARQALIQQAKELQDSLLQIVDKVESAKSEHEKLESGNRFLQSYIGELMQTSKLTATGIGKGRKGKASK